MIPLSAVFITKDEERNLGPALASVAFCDEIVVVDSGSTDRTRELAQAAGARVIVNVPWPGFKTQRNISLDAASHDFVLALDADERVTPELREEIEALRSRGFDAAGYRIPRVSFYLGRYIRATDWYPDWQLRLLDRRRGRCEGALVHESIRVDGVVRRLRGEIEHRPYSDIGDHMRTIETYTTLWARQSFDAGRRTSALEAILASSWSFFRNYVLRRGALLGSVGLTVSALNAYYTFVKLAKLVEMQNDARKTR